MASTRSETTETTTAELERISELFCNTYIKNGALTVFINPAIDASGERMLIADHDLTQARRRCLPFSMTGHRDHPQHDSWHKSAADFEIRHYHLLNHPSGPGTTPITPTDAKCIFRELKYAEIDRGYCQDGQTECYLTDAHTSTFFPNNHAKLRASRKKRFRELPPEVVQRRHEEELNQILNQAFITFCQSFTRAFLKQMINRYLVPYLITHRFDPTDDPRTAQPRYSIESIKTVTSLFSDVIELMLSKSWIGYGIGIAIERMVIPALKKLGIPDGIPLIGLIIANIKSALDQIFSDKFLPNLASGALGTALGYQLGYDLASALIQLLPKVKQECPPDTLLQGHGDSDSDSDTAVVVRAASSSGSLHEHEGLRRRR